MQAKIYVDGTLKREVHRKMREELRKLPDNEVRALTNSPGKREALFDRIVRELGGSSGQTGGTQP